MHVVSVNGRWNFHIIWIIFITLQTLSAVQITWNILKFSKVFHLFVVAVECVHYATTHVHAKYTKSIPEELSILNSILWCRWKKNFFNSEMPRYSMLQIFTIIISYIDRVVGWSRSIEVYDQLFCVHSGSQIVSCIELPINQLNEPQNDNLFDDNQSD